MNGAGNNVPGGYAAHHKIATSVANNHPVTQEAIKRGIYDPNRASNGIALPTTAAESLTSGKTLHSGGHTKNYFDTVRSKLDAQHTKMGNLSKVSDAELLRKIGAVERSIQMDLKSDRLRIQNNDPRPAGTKFC